MEVRHFMKLYARSASGILSLALSLAAGFALAPFFGVALAVGTGLVLASTLAVVALVSGYASKVAHREAERLAWLDAKPYLEKTEVQAKRLETLRLPDEGLKDLANLAALRARAYVQAARFAKIRDPLADEAVAEALAALDLYLRELDDASTERRYGLPDDDPVPEARTRVSELLIDKTSLLERSTRALSGLEDRNDSLSIKESLR